MKTTKLQSALLIVFLLISFVSWAQIPILSALNNPITTTESIPFEFKRYGTQFSYEYGFTILNSDGLIPDKFYKNVQMTDFETVGEDTELGARLYRKFAIPNSSNMLAVVSFGGPTHMRSNVICVVSSSGQILSTLLGTVSFSLSTIKQFRINAQCQIIVSTITTASTVSIPLDNFTSFTGQRKDVTYSINANGQFVNVSEQLFQPKTYTHEILENELNICQGGEIPL